MIITLIVLFHSGAKCLPLRLSKKAVLKKNTPCICPVYPRQNYVKQVPPLLCIFHLSILWYLGETCVFSFGHNYSYDRNFVLFGQSTDITLFQLR